MSEAEGQASPTGQPPEPQQPSPGRSILPWLVALLATAVLAAVIWLDNYANAPAPVAADTIVLIPKGAGAGEIGTILARHQLLADDPRFLLLATLTGLARHLRAGEYLIPARATPLQILRQLEQGSVVRETVTIPEGLHVGQIAGLLARDGWIDEQRFISLAGDRDFIRSVGIDQASLEGYLFPDTYQLTRGDVTEEGILRMMTVRFARVWQEVTAAGKPAMSRHQIVTLASIVEKETGAAAERPLIARVFLNRLARNMRLQSDPTVIYGIKSFDGDLTSKHLRLETPYNTYVIDGLPPGPICSPGQKALEAVLRPADNPSLFFVSKNDGTHHFSITLNEHNQAVAKYQKKMNGSEKPKPADETSKD
ncbi:MAG: endolytic transglycosylase MltG [Desulfobulbaceae bacterium]